MKLNIKIITFMPLFFLACSTNIDTGLDIISKSNFQLLKGKNIGLIINHTSLDKFNNHILDLLYSNNINIKKIFSPEHGFKGDKSAGEFVDDSIDELSGTEIISLYGIKKNPSKKHLDDIDVLIFDIQDIGSRYYTYVSTMYIMMEMAANQNIEFIVLDRPNPLGREISGPIMQNDFKSFVGIIPIPIRHGMTIGEIAKMIDGEGWIDAKNTIDLKVISLAGWNTNPGYFQVSPSPNIPDFITALCYSGMCLLEGTNISEGRGTENPFLYFGAPWIESSLLTKQLNSLSLNGVRFESISFVPKSTNKSKWPKYQDIMCHGSRIIVTNRSDYEPIKVTLEIIKLISENYPENFKFLESNFIDKLYGSKKLRKWLKSEQKDLSIYEDWDTDFETLREKYLLY